MKRTLAIFFLLIFLFHAGGYYAVFWAFHYQAEKNLTRRLDDGHYTAEEEITITIPVSLPYPIHQREYERTEGEFQHKGETYKLVKRKLEGDVLLVVCVRNVQVNKLKLAMSDYSKILNDLPTQSKQTLSLLGKIFKDFTSVDAIVFAGGDGKAIRLRNTEESFNILHQYYPVISPPPEAWS